MKTTKKNITRFVKHMLSTDKNWALKALVKIYSNQTDDEQNLKETRWGNDLGFNKWDAKFLSSIAEQYQRRGFLTPKQMEKVFKHMPKYHKQIVMISNMEKLLPLVENFINETYKQQEMAL